MKCDIIHNCHKGMLGFIIIFAMACALASSCVERYACEYIDTKPLDSPFKTNSTHDLHPRSCVHVCNADDKCVAVLHDSLGENCLFYSKSNVGSGITKDPGTKLWWFQAQGTPCIQVSWIIILISMDWASRKGLTFNRFLRSPSLTYTLCLKHNHLIHFCYDISKISWL